MENFEEIRKAFINFGKAKAILNFYNSEINSYVSLISNGLKKPNDLSVK